MIWTVAAEVTRWVQVLRGEGRRAHRITPWRTIRIYLATVRPVLDQWRGRSLRDISRSDVDAVLRQLHGYQARSTATALRSLFRALKQERAIFADPTRGLTVTDAVTLPTPLPSDRLHGLLDRADSLAVRLVIALIAIHALTCHDVRHLRRNDLDLPRGRLTVRREEQVHVVYLDATTYQLARRWLQERRRRWPRTTNPYLLVSAYTAADTRHRPVSSGVIVKPLQRLGHTAGQLRTDRILHEARITEDPVRLIRLFGISVTTAMRYLHAAHPERGSVPPR